jgi:hypothetical protein
LRSFAVAKSRVHYFTCIDIRLSDRVRSFDCTIRSTYRKVAIGFPVIVKPTIGSVTITFVGSVPWLLQSIVITSPTFPVPPTAAVFTRAIRGFVSMGYP